ncbi:hypothetical protein FACS1894166_04980 [Bacilli bacterium]|nr:hypothetical protein FACS1894166_04980 [Bacilli bacterium]
MLDIGASTGGFSEVALLHGAKLVYAVDVGTNQLHHSLKSNFKLVAWEQTHFDKLSKKHIPHKVDFVLADISFISLTKLMDKLNKLITYPHYCIFLIKPEFELSPSELNKGKVKNLKLEEKAIHKITQYALALHYRISGIIPSPIKGNKLQNTEYLLYMEQK